MSEKNFAVMFADIADSSALYKSIGNAKAKMAVLEALNKIAKLIKQHEGTVVKLIGDEILCYFATADLAVLAAANIQQSFKQSSVEYSPIPSLALRIGIHWGPAILEQKDIFGDAVNTAARMVSAAKEKQIVVTPATVSALNAALRTRCRAFDLAKIKAFNEPMVLYIVDWDQDTASDATFVSTTRQFAIENAQQPTFAILSLRFQDITCKVASNQISSFYIGRDKEGIDLSVNSRFASRRHAWLAFHREKFVLTDHSTNGTYIVFEQDPDQEIFLKREEIPLWGAGKISLGQSTKTNHHHLIFFSS